MDRTCAECNKKFVGFGNNGAPLYEGIVCNECNIEVINYRFITMMKGTND